MEGTRVLADGSTAAGVVVTVVIVAVVLALAVLFLAALVSILRSPLDPVVKLACIIGCLVFQFFGPLLWFVVGRPVAERGRQR